MKVLVAEDEKISRLRLVKFLEGIGCEVISCEDGLEAWNIINSDDAPNFLILDWMMPGMDGVEMCRKARELNREPYTFIMLLSSKGEHEDVVKGMEAGADDYIVKPFNQNELKVRLSAGSRIVQLNEDLLNARNILEKQAVNDSLTGMFNRHYMVEVLGKEFSSALRYQTELSCLLLDIDYFKEINDNYGHPFGDFVLREFANCLKQEARKMDIPFRYGGEEFLILLPNTDVEGAQYVAEKIRVACEEKTYDDGTNSAKATVSIGIASVKLNKPLEAKELIAYADKALYRAKAEGRNRVNIYFRKPFGEVDSNEDGKGNDFRYLKENLSLILEKTKKSAIDSLNLLARNVGGDDQKQHSNNVNQYIKLIGERLSLPPSIIETFKRAAVFQDNFKTLMRKTLKTNSKTLSKEEKADLEGHPYMLSELIDQFDFFAHEKSILLYHREYFDGTGYPGGLKESEIPLGARLFAIANAIATMLSDQPGRKSLSPEEIVTELADYAGKKFDPMMVSLYFEIIEKQKLLPVSEDFLKEAKEKVNKLK
jgi:diguanylate cyclase (GGDEF)-like protein